LLNKIAIDTDNSLLTLTIFVIARNVSKDTKLMIKQEPCYNYKMVQHGIQAPAGTDASMS